jgi:hypothetical protein
MCFESMARMKELQERLVTRMHNFRKRAEKSMGQAILVVEVNGALAGWGYANERWGDPPPTIRTPRDIRQDRGDGPRRDRCSACRCSVGSGTKARDQHRHRSTGAFSYRLGAVAGVRPPSPTPGQAGEDGRPARPVGQGGADAGRQTASRPVRGVSARGGAGVSPAGAPPFVFGSPLPFLEVMNHGSSTDVGALRAIVGAGGRSDADLIGYSSIMSPASPQGSVNWRAALAAAGSSGAT